MQFSRRSSPSPPRRSNALLRGLSGINQAFQQVGLTSPDPIGTRASFESNVVVSPSVRGSDRAPSSSNPPAFAPNNVSVDTGVDCRVPGSPRRDPAAVPVDEFFVQADRSVTSALNTAFIASSAEDSRQSRVNENEEVQADDDLTYHDRSPVGSGSGLPADDASRRRPNQEFSNSGQSYGSNLNNDEENNTYRDSRQPFGRGSSEFQPPVGSGFTSRAESLNDGGSGPSRDSVEAVGRLPRTPWSRGRQGDDGSVFWSGHGGGGRGRGWPNDGGDGFGGDGRGRLSHDGYDASAGSPRAPWSRSSYEDDDDASGFGRGSGGRGSGRFGRHGHDGFGSDSSVRRSVAPDGSGGLSPRAVPRNLFELSSSFVRVDKYKRAQLDFRALEKLRKDATSAPEGQVSCWETSSDTSPGVQDLRECSEACGPPGKSATPPLICPAHNFLVTRLIFLLFTHHDELDLDEVLEWQHWFLVWASDTDIQSGQWLSQLVLNSLKPDLRDEVSRELSGLPLEHQGSASTLWIALDKVNVSSYETTETLKSFITNFKLSAYPHENVRIACTQFKAILKALLAANDIPTQAATMILAGFGTSSDKALNTICENLSLHERIVSPRRRRRTISTSKSLYKHLVEDILPVLEDYHRDHELAGSWAGLGNPGSYQPASSAAFVTAPVRSAGDPFCFNCGEKHDKKDCKKPFPNPDRPQWVADECAKLFRERDRGRDTSRGRRGDRSQSRGRSTSRPRDSSKRQQTPGRPRASSRSVERKTVSFDNKATALNVTLPDGGSDGRASQSDSNSYKAALIMSKLQEQLGKE
eukprot:scaffold6171_cov22-Cyclotella_meneghiniana.AAC.2